MVCEECQQEKRLAARGLCSACYGKVRDVEKSAVCDGCKEFKPIKAKRFCHKCYARFQRHGDTSRERKKKGDTLCSHCNEKPMHAKGFCKGCYQRYRNTGSPEYIRRVYTSTEVDKRKQTNSHLVRTFNITIEDYETMLDKQNNVCAICGKGETREYNGTRIKLAVDHCHITGEVRGLLCSKCNLALGWFDDSSELLTKAINYLKETTTISK